MFIIIQNIWAFISRQYLILKCKELIIFLFYFNAIQSLVLSCHIFALAVRLYNFTLSFVQVQIVSDIWQEGYVLANSILISQTHGHAHPFLGVIDTLLIKDGNVILIQIKIGQFLNVFIIVIHLRTSPILDHPRIGSPSSS